jgi:hypothetical protein
MFKQTTINRFNAFMSKGVSIEKNKNIRKSVCFIIRYMDRNMILQTLEVSGDVKQMKVDKVVFENNEVYYFRDMATPMLNFYTGECYKHIKPLPKYN